MGAQPFTSDSWDIEAVLEVWVHDNTDPARVVLVGQLDAATAAHVHDLLVSLRSRGRRHIDVDLGGVHVVDDQGLDVLAGAARVAAGAGGRVRLVRPSAPVERALELTGAGPALVPVLGSPA